MTPVVMLKDFYSPKYGGLLRGQTYTVDDETANLWFLDDVTSIPGTTASLTAQGRWSPDKPEHAESWLDAEVRRERDKRAQELKEAFRAHEKGYWEPSPAAKTARGVSGSYDSAIVRGDIQPRSWPMQDPPPAHKVIQFPQKKDPPSQGSTRGGRNIG